MRAASAGSDRVLSLRRSERIQSKNIGACTVWERRPPNTYDTLLPTKYVYGETQASSTAPRESRDGPCADGPSDEQEHEGYRQRPRDPHQLNRRRRGASEADQERGQEPAGDGIIRAEREAAVGRVVPSVRESFGHRAGGHG